LRRLAEPKGIDGRFTDHERLLVEVMTIKPARSPKLVAQQHREE